MTREATPPTWFPDGKIDAEQVTNLSRILTQTARQLGFTRETFAAAVGQMAEALTGSPRETDIDADVQRFVGERLLAAGAALTEVN